MPATLFEQAKIAEISLKNRIIRSATHEGMADEYGYPTDALKKAYLRLARGRAGAIITGYAGIQPNGKAPIMNMLMADDDRCVEAYRELVDAVHQEGTAIILQIAHCGRQTSSKATGFRPVAPSAIRDRYYFDDRPRELAEHEIEEIIGNFVRAVQRAKDAGFDGVQLHAAHGYLLSEFLSPYMNRRTDRWGGTMENRFRIVGEILKRARLTVGEYPVLVKLNAHDGRKNGMRIEEAVRIASMLDAHGCKAIEVSCGVAEDGLYMSRGDHTPIDAVFAYSSRFKNLPKFVKAMIRPFADYISPPVKPVRLYNVEAARRIKQSVSIPVIVVGGISSIDDITDIIAGGSADFVSMCRPFIIEPDIVKRMQEGRQKESRCIACNFCMIAAEERPLQCYYGKVKVR